jgi:hypothetical protein
MPATIVDKVWNRTVSNLYAIEPTKAIALQETYGQVAPTMRQVSVSGLLAACELLDLEVLIVPKTG